MTSTTTLGKSETPGSRQATARSGFRPDIQGLRAIAVGIVVLYHLWPKRLQGGFVGVDVFFVISGFLITQHLVSKPPRQPRDFAAFWARRIRRLLPASLLVVSATLAAVYALGNESVWQDTGKQAAASALYVQNWVLAFSSVDYLAEDNAPTAVQHFWSLSVEEQFYFIWPLIIAALIAVGIWRKRLAATLRLGLGVLMVAGLLYSVWYTDKHAAMAYFVTTTRLWELAAGGVVAVFVMGRGPNSGPVSSSVAWLGIAGIAVAALTIDPADPFPGAAAILPVVATALVLAAHATGRLSPAGLLGLWPVQFIGNTSYSIYLWHWPLLTLAPMVTMAPLSWPQKLVIGALSILLAWLTMELVEKRFRRLINRLSLPRVFIFTAVVMALVAGSGFWMAATASARETNSLSSVRQAESNQDSCLGVAAWAPNASQNKACSTGDHLLLTPSAAKVDRPDSYQDDCMSNQPFTRRPVCTYGDGKTKVALIGNSHAAHWLPALQELAKQRDWTITTFLVTRCNATTDKLLSFPAEKSTQNCHAYSQWVKKQTTEGGFDAIVTSERQSKKLKGDSWAQTDKWAADGYEPMLKAWHEAKIPVVDIRDTPAPMVNIPDCIATYGATSPKCQGTPEKWKTPDPLAQAVKRLGYPEQHVVASQSFVCRDDKCPATLGGLVIWVDGTHLTASYSRTLAPLLAKELDDVGVNGL